PGRRPARGGGGRRRRRAGRTPRHHLGAPARGSRGPRRAVAVERGGRGMGAPGPRRCGGGPVTSPLPAAVAGLSAVALVLGLWRLVSAPRTPVAPVPVTAPARRRGDRWLPAGFGQRLGRRLARGGIPLSPGAFIAAAAVVAGLAALAPVVVL